VPYVAWILALLASAAIAPAADSSQTAPRKAVTFTRDVAPVLFQHCAPCHRPGEVGPFPLLTYDDARSRARQIAEVTATGEMPPWKPAAGFGGPFVGERRLTAGQIATIAAWVEQGAPEGDAADLPRMPAWPTGWRLGTPDLVITMPEPYMLPASGQDVFRNFVLPIPTDAVKYVAAIEFRPNSRAAHHANLRIDPTHDSRERDLEDPLPGYEGPISPNAQYPDGHFLGWTPGQLTPPAPKGMAWPLAPAGDVVIQIHMQPSGKPEAVQPSVGFFFVDDRPDRTPVMLRLGRQRIDIPAGTARYVTEDRYTLPVDVQVHGVQPHAHLRATEIRGRATLPDGTTRWLIYIPKWDFNWQDAYRYAEPVFLPRGTTLSMEWTYDNSPANPRNPDRPPRRILYGQNSTDEMGDLWFQVLPASPQDRERLFEDFRPKLLAEDAAGYETMLLGDPDNAKLHDYLALLYWDLGKIDQAIARFEATVRLDPRDAKARYNFAMVLVESGRIEEAAAQLRSAIAIKPDDAAAQNNLGAVLLTQSRVEEAVGHFREAVRLEPRSAMRRSNLGHSLVLSGRPEEGIQHLRESIRLDPQYAEAHSNLGRALMALGQFDEAVRMAEQAVTLTRRQNIDAIEVMAEAYAAVGRFDAAVEATETAIGLVSAATAAPVAERLRARLDAYRRGQRFVGSQH
jgi:tetratricopeptide (TPR) repeat protein/mono/diheme cytochrome c family protein